jgi:hypothetical protein
MMSPIGTNETCAQTTRMSEVQVQTGSERYPATLNDNPRLALNAAIDIVSGLPPCVFARATVGERTGRMPNGQGQL